ncbi:MAG: histidinol-phosphate transaminase [Actinomycetia bacterium]|nr:histidinol-phosphate transaminase [Actinomycetes bacterium]MCP3911405.1 histidinol-phosphate transaminase [Actinomycetes bacterium]MCP4084218.1 histidinol-phosphate transaminase [Actinomycetes bacterium]
MIGRPRPAVTGLPAYRPGKSAAQAASEQGLAEAIKLASNETPWGPLPSIQEAIARAAAGGNRYADHRCSELRARLADRVGVTAENVTVGNGSVGLLQQIYLSYVERGAEVVYPWRSFEVYPIYTQLVGGIEVTTPLVDEAFDLDAVAAAVTERTSLMVLANPNNPTGTAVSIDQVADLLDRVPDDIIVVLDEAYREFMSDDLGEPIGAGLLEAHPNLVITRTFSKAHGLAGFRVGYAVGHPEVVELVDRTLVPFAVNQVAQAAALAALEPAAEAELRERVEVIVGQRDRLISELGRLGLEVPDSQANFVWIPSGGRTLELTRSLEQRGLVTRPFEGEGLRITASTPSETDRVIEALEEIL